MPCNETLRSVAFAEALIMLRHDFEGAKIRKCSWSFEAILSIVYNWLKQIGMGADWYILFIYKCHQFFWILCLAFYSKWSQYFFQRGANEMAEVTLSKAVIIPFLIFSALKFAAWPDALAAIWICTLYRLFNFAEKGLNTCIKL